MEKPMIVLITGTATELGVNVTRKFAQNGHQVVVTGQHSDRLEALTAELGKNVLPIVLEDPTCRNAIRGALAALPKDWQDIDILINDATLSLGNRLAHEASLEDWEAMIDANCSSLVAMTREILPGMLRRHTGMILNLSSAKEQEPSQGSNIYGATVAFVHQYTLSLIESLTKSGVRASCIAPNRRGGSELMDVYGNNGDPSENGHKEIAFIPTDADIVEAIYWIATLPAHVNINYMELAQTGQLFSPLAIKPNQVNH